MNMIKSKFIYIFVNNKSQFVFEDNMNWLLPNLNSN